MIPAQCAGESAGGYVRLDAAGSNGDLLRGAHDHGRTPCGTKKLILLNLESQTLAMNLESQTFPQIFPIFSHFRFFLAKSSPYVTSSDYILPLH